MTSTKSAIAPSLPKATAVPPRETRQAWRPWLAGAVLFILVVLAYVPLVRAGFIWDDDYYVFKNVALRSAKGLWEIWASPFRPVTPQYYPFTFTTFWLEYHLWGVNPLGYHIVNVVLHSLSALVLWRLLRKLQIPGAWLAAAVFALHPVHVESVAWVSERKNVLSGLLFLLALTAYLRWRGLTHPATSASDDNPRITRSPSRWWYAAALFLFALAVFSKTVASSLPAVILLITYWKRGRVNWRDALLLAPFFAIGISLGSLTSWLERHFVGADGPEWHFSLLQRALIAGRSLWFYAQKLVWPGNLIFVYPRWEIDPHKLSLFVFLGAALAVPIALWLLRRRLGRGPLVAVLFFGGCLFPALGFANIYPMRFSFVADHFQYLASIGLIVLLVGAGASLLRRLAPDAPIMGTVIGGSLVIMLMMTTFLRTSVFRSPKLLWTDTTEKNHGAWMAYKNLASLLMKEKDYAGARKALDSALAVEPNYTYSRLSRVALEILAIKDPSKLGKQDTTRAIAEAREALASVAGDQSLLGRTEQSNCWQLMSSIFFAQHDEPAAEDAFHHLVLLDPDDLIARLDLARMQYVRHETPAAEEEFRHVLALDANNVEARRYLSRILFDRRDDRAAQDVLRPLLSLDSRNAAVHWELAQILEHGHDFAGALAQWQQVIRIDPANAEAHAHSALLEAQAGRATDAANELAMAKKLDKRYAAYTLSTALRP